MYLPPMNEEISTKIQLLNNCSCLCLQAFACKPSSPGGEGIPGMIRESRNGFDYFNYLHSKLSFFVGTGLTMTAVG